MDIPHKKICETIIKLKTSILVIEQQKNVCAKLEACLLERNIEALVRSKNLKGKCQIKPFDIYIINCEDYKKDEKYQILRKILENNNQANIFLLNETEEEQEIINSKFRNILHPLKNQVIAGIVACDENGLQKILETIESVEICKLKIHELWTKLEKSL